MPKIRKTPSLSSLLRNDYNIPSVERSTVQRVQAAWRFAFPLQHYINRRVGEELPQHSLPLHCCSVKKFNHSRSFLHCAFKRTLHRLWLTSSDGLASSNSKNPSKWPECDQLQGYLVRGTKLRPLKWHQFQK
jgi:hypothetical protein